MPAAKRTELALALILGGIEPLPQNLAAPAFTQPFQNIFVGNKLDPLDQGPGPYFGKPAAQLCARLTRPRLAVAAAVSGVPLRLPDFPCSDATVGGRKSGGSHVT